MHATHFIAENAPDLDTPDAPTQHGECAFCGTIGTGFAAEDTINEKYFSDSPVMQADTEHVCLACAQCMTTRDCKNGHWATTPGQYESIPTGDLPELLERVRSGALGPPVALHVSDNPIRSEHAYLWTPVARETDWLLCDYDGQTVRMGWGELDALVGAVEDCRWHGFRLDDIREGCPHVSALAEMGEGAYRRADDVIDTHRGTADLELALTLSRSADDQDPPSTNE